MSVAAEDWAAAVPGYPYDMHPSRALSSDGNRLFFDSYDALLLTDTNEAKDVYMWQAPDSGDCDASDANYFEQNGGCLSLISTGKDSRASSFVDASADGSDVFFSSGERLHGSDVDELIDIYDARIGGGFPPPPPSPGACDLDAGACEGPGTEAPDGSGAGSAVFEGPGNMQPRPQTKRCPKGKRKVTRGAEPAACPRRPKSAEGPTRTGGRPDEARAALPRRSARTGFRPPKPRPTSVGRASTAAPSTGLGDPVTQAGAHPHVFGTGFAFNTVPGGGGPNDPPVFARRGRPRRGGDPAPGFLGDPTVVPTCPAAQFFDVVTCPPIPGSAPPSSSST